MFYLYTDLLDITPFFRISDIFDNYKDLRKDVKTFYDFEAAKTSLFFIGLIEASYGSDKRIV